MMDHPIQQGGLITGFGFVAVIVESFTPGCDGFLNGRLISFRQFRF
jgi:hypothetical protein